jgi:hypothetical protein
MLISDNDLLRWAEAYIENGRLKKWRYDNQDLTHMDAILSKKQYSQEPLTEREFNYIMTFNNVIVVDKNLMKFYRFSGDIIKG